MKEILSKRSFTAKHFQLENNLYRMDAHIGHIHYRDGPLKDGEFRDIDTHLNYNPISKFYAMISASYEAEIGLYGDVRFHNVDHSITFQFANPNKIQATAYDGSEFGKQGKALIWRNLIQDGGHQIVETRNGNLAKIFHFDEKPKSNIIDFAIDLTGQVDFESPSDKPTPLKTTSVKSQQTKFLSLGGKRTFIRPVRAWNHRRESIDIALNFYLDKDGKLRAAKTIPQAFIDKTFTEKDAWLECDTTTSFYAGAGDGYYGRLKDYGLEESFSVMRSGAQIYYDTAGTQITVPLWAGNSEEGSIEGYHSMTRSAFPYDTSGLGAAAAITSANALFYVLVKSDTLQAASNMSIDRYTSAGYAVGNYNGTRQANDIATPTTSAYNSFALNATGLSNINKTGTSQFSLRLSHDLDNSDPGWVDAGGNYFTVYSSEGTYPPYLSITYTVPQNYSMPAGLGSIVLSGQAINLTRQAKIGITAGTYSLIGKDAGLLWAHKFTVSTGSFILAGQDTALRKGYGFNAEAGSFILTGQDVGWKYDHVLSPVAGSLAIVGKDAGLLFGRKLEAETGAYIVTGKNIIFGHGYTIIIGAGSYSLAGEIATLLRTRVLQTVVGSYILTGFDTETKTFKLVFKNRGPGFKVNDLLVARRLDFDENGVRVTLYDIDAEVQQVGIDSSGNEYAMIYVTSGWEYVPEFGTKIKWMVIGNKTDSIRGATISLIADDSTSPKVTLRSGVTSHTLFRATSSIRAQLGNLSGITDSNFGALSGYGLYTENAYLTGWIAGGTATSLTAGIGYWFDPTGNFRVGDPSANYLKYDTSTGIVTLVGSIAVMAGSIAGMTITSTALTATAGGNSTIVSSGATAFAAGPTGSPGFTVLQTGAVTCSNITITGGKVPGTVLTSLYTVPMLVAGTINSSTGAWANCVMRLHTPGDANPTDYTITNGSPTNGHSYIYWLNKGSIFTSSTGLPSSMNQDIVLIAFKDSGGTWRISMFQNVLYADIISCTVLSAFTTNTGTLIIGSGGYLRMGQTAYETGTGFWMGDVGGTPKFSIGSTAAYLKWNGTALSIKGAIDITTGSLAGFTLDATSLSFVGGGNTVTISSGTNALIAGPTGAPTFTVTAAGALSAVAGTIADWTLGATSFSKTAGGNTVTLSTGSNALIAGPTGAPTFTVTAAGALTATSATITGAIQSGSTIMGSTIISAVSMTGQQLLIYGSSGISVGKNDLSIAGVIFIANGAASTTELRADAYGSLTCAGYVVWDAGNDGSGSGLDADLLDGSHRTTILGQVQANLLVAADASRGLYNISQLGIGVTANTAGYEFEVASVGTANCDVIFRAGTGNFAINVLYNGVTQISSAGIIEFKKEFQMYSGQAAGSATATMTNAPALASANPYQWAKVYASDGTLCVIPLYELD